MKPHHLHQYQPPPSDPSDWGSEGMSTLFCYDEDCSKGLDLRTFPVELIGPKLIPLAWTVDAKR